MASTDTNSSQAAPTAPTHPDHHGQPRGFRNSLAGILTQRSVQIAIVLWIAGSIFAIAAVRGSLPFDRPLLAGESTVQQVIGGSIGLLEILVLFAVVMALTRNRVIPNIAARVPAVAQARHETVLLICYGALAQFGGVVLGQAFHWHPISFHVAGTIYGAHQHDYVSQPEVFAWILYNFTFYALLPWLVFRRHYSAEEMLLRSHNRRRDILLIVVVLAIESTAQLAGVSDAFLKLSPHQLLVGAPLTFTLYFFGTVLPTMIFVQCLLVPRYLKLSGSAATTVILGGATYALLHVFEAWTVFTSPMNVTLSLIFIILQYFGPGMFKTVLTLRTGNAWVHVWAYHAIAPHTIIDTPLMVNVFHIR